jgi:GT2 family glycosyltransferase
MVHPLISIIITSYNYGSMIGEAIGSACAQDYPNIEVVVLDNASTDNTESVIQDYIKHPRVRYIRNKLNIGAMGNHNRGVIESRGEYLMFLSADDRMASDQVSATYACLKAHPQAQIAYSEIRYINDSGEDYGERPMLIPLHYSNMPNSLALYLAWGCYSAFETLLIPREIFGLYGLLDTDLVGADYELMTRWAAAGVQLAFVPGRYLSYRLHSSQDSGADKFYANGKGLTELLTIIERYATPQNMPKLRSYQHKIMRHIQLKLDYAEKQGFCADEQTVRRINDLSARLTAGERVGTISLQPPKVHVIILGDNNAAHLETTLASLARQTSPHWDATVLHPFGSFPTIFRRAENIKEMVVQERLAEGAILNSGVPFSTAPYTTFLRAGNTFAPEHIEKIQAAFSAHTVDLLLTGPRLVVDGHEMPECGIYTNFADLTATIVVPNIPLEAITASARTLDAIGLFDPRAKILAEWSFVMCRYGQTSTAVLSESTVYINEESGQPNAYASSPHLLATVEHTYSRIVCADDYVQKARLDYSEHLQDFVRQMNASQWTAQDHALWHQGICGQLTLTTA